ncbi:MAG: hypothetical protein KBS47_06280 [Bacteroidales bacterium]|nr:hypothetical protein [Candidatus Equimonas enterica]
MKYSEHMLKQIERAIRKAADKCPTVQQEPRLTDLYLQVIQESGEIRIYDDDDNELTRCVVEEWINDPSDTFMEDVQQPIKEVLIAMRPTLDAQLNLLRPYSFVLIDEGHDIVTELYVVDDDAIIVDGDLMKDLDDDLDDFIGKLLDD